MNLVDGAVVVSALNTLIRTEIILSSNQSMWMLEEPSRLNTVSVMLDRLIEQFTSLGLTVTVKGAQEVKSTILLADKGSAATASMILAELQEVRKRLAHELEGRMIYGLDMREAEWIRQTKPLFGVEVEDKFPSAVEEIVEAGKCLGFNRYTAAVFHLMRVLEIGLNELGKALGLEVAQNWHTALRDIEDEIKKRNKANQGPTWVTDEPFYSEAAAYFRVLKNAWRNHTMHITNRYDEERALGVYNTTRDFMRHLATRLSE